MLFRALDLQLPAGSVTWLRGSNGSGKTSLMRILAGLSAPFEGEVLWGGQSLSQTGAAARAQLAYIGHSNALKDDLTLLEAVAFLATLSGLDDATRRAHAALDQLGLADRRDALVRTLSQGQRRRGALARLLFDEAPRTWILDEPFDALDAASASTLAALIAAHAARQGAVLLTSHQPISIAGAGDFDLEPWCCAA